MTRAEIEWADWHHRNRLAKRALAKDREPWLRQPQETARAYAALQAYFDMGPLDRSLSKTAGRIGRSLSMTERWASRWSWVKRAQA